MSKWTLAALIGLFLATFTVGVPYALIPAFAFYFYALDHAGSMKTRLIETLIFQWVAAFIVTGIIQAESSIWNGGWKIYSLLALIIMPALMGYLVLHMLWRHLIRNENVWLRVLSSAVAFTLLEQWIAYEKLSFGQFFINEPLVTGWVPVLGGSILTFLTILSAEVLALILDQLRQPKPARTHRLERLTAALALIFVVWIAPSFGLTSFLRKTDQAEPTRPVSFALLQTNFDGATLVKEVAGHPASTDLVLGTYDRLIAAIPEKPDQPQILVGGEVTFPALEGRAGAELRGVDRVRAWLKNEKRLLVVGAAYFNSAGEHENVAMTARIENNELKQRSFRKRIFLPFGETVGTSHQFPWIEKMIFEFPYAPAGTVPLFQTFDGLPIGLILCSEVFHRDLFLELYRMGARAFVVSGNELSSFRTLGQAWLLSGARLRSLEIGVPIVKAANSGGSAILDGNGRFLYKAPLGETVSHEQTIAVSLNPQPTFFVRHPDLLDLFFNSVLLISLIALARTWTPRLRRSQRKSETFQAPSPQA